MNQVLPSFSIIIPTYERPEQLHVCLDALVKLDYPHHLFEVIVVDDENNTPLGPIIAIYSNKMNLTLIRQTHGGPAAARNKGASNAKGDFLAFTDDDCIASLDWLKVLASRFKDAPDCIIGGRTINYLIDNIYSATSQIIIDIVYGHYNAKPNHSLFFASNNIALSKNIYTTIGGFDSSFLTSEDRDFCNRCLYHGFQMIYEPKAIIYHAHTLNLQTFSKQHFNYGRGAFRYHLRRIQRGSGSFLEDLKFHLNLRNLFLYPFSQVNGYQVIPLASLLIIWQLVNAAGFFWEAGSYASRTLSKTSL
ncbi:MAG TPA: glycosyltransferase [Thermodesulfobacteriota bacterium]|jgi:glycosyltransferase involved in cell wall biosynthesis